MIRVNGEFKIQMEPQTPAFKGLDDAKTGRMSFRKAYSGKFEAVGIGEMLSLHCPNPANAGYVAIEQVKGTLDGKKGGFVLQHYGIKTAENSDLTVEIIPGSGTGNLTGITGSMMIRVEGKRHLYELSYELETIEA